MSLDIRREYVYMDWISYGSDVTRTSQGCSVFGNSLPQPPLNKQNIVVLPQVDNDSHQAHLSCTFCNTGWWLWTSSSKFQNYLMVKLSSTDSINKDRFFFFSCWVFMSDEEKRAWAVKWRGRFSLLANCKNNWPKTWSGILVRCIQLVLIVTVQRIFSEQTSFKDMTTFLFHHVFFLFSNLCMMSALFAQLVLTNIWGIFSQYLHISPNRPQKCLFRGSTLLLSHLASRCQWLSVNATIPSPMEQNVKRKFPEKTCWKTKVSLNRHNLQVVETDEQQLLGLDITFIFNHDSFLKG